MTRIATGWSERLETADAVAEAVSAVRGELGGAPVDLAFVFLTADHLDRAAGALDLLADELGARATLGCVAQGVIAGQHELESTRCISVWAASLPGAAIETVRLEPGETGPSLDLSGADVVFALVDPFSFPADELLDWANEAYPGVPIVGGLAPGAAGGGGQALVCGRHTFPDGAVLASVTGVQVDAFVSQGCTPLGPDSVITRAEANVVLELAGRPAVERLRELVASLSAHERALVTQGLLAGLVVDENQPEYRRGDFLVRSIIGADERTGALAIGDEVRVGQTLRFHARDAASADRDLHDALREALAQPTPPATGALLFTCNGRGVGMFGEPHHDARAVADAIGSEAVAGIFCAGEIGPIGGQNFLHGFSATVAIFRDADGL